jgi:hypothetical protein
MKVMNRLSRIEALLDRRWVKESLMPLCIPEIIIVLKRQWSRCHSSPAPPIVDTPQPRAVRSHAQANCTYHTARLSPSAQRAHVGSPSHPH